MGFQGQTRKSKGNRSNLGTFKKETDLRHYKQNKVSNRASDLNNLNKLIEANGGTLPKDWDIRKARKFKTKSYKNDLQK